ncbi:MAG TPA: zinc ribbon domain-containing protein [Gemmatimonadaceae bacterium]|nr:zinc ribbon domain-containing protein [Gemmatimonadaceae bacterium]
MFRRLVQTIRTEYPQYLTIPIAVDELHHTILPYRRHRQALGLETNQDYEITLLELLSGSRGYMIVDDRMRDRLVKIVASPNPDPAALHEFASERVALSPDALNLLEAADAAGRHSTGATRSIDHAAPPSQTARCQYCEAVLPSGRLVTFCPHCGQNVTLVNCSACGAELESGWRFCTTCGRATGGPS